MVSPWPAIIYVLMTLFGLGVSLANHGRPETGTKNFFLVLGVCAFQTWLLWWGGFFDRILP